MKQIDKSDARFEQQLRQSARRLRDQQNYALPVRKLPYRPTRITWVASAAAAAIGWVVGVSFPIAWFVGIAFPIDGQQQPKELTACAVPDTVVTVRDRIVRDTIVQQVKIPVRVSTEKVVVKKENEAKVVLAGCNMECDGIDYSQLVGM
ncbi:unknown [Prevotella sp. CAG:891]|nr:unknown [Prevotella sp. CAG:891]